MNDHSDTAAALSEQEMNQLLRPVSLPSQQRSELVRVGLRPGLPAAYKGLVELSDLRLMLSPWHWAATELASTPRTAELNRVLVKAREAGGACGLDTVAGVATWLTERLNEMGLSWDSFPGDNVNWGHWRPLREMVEDGNNTFLPPGLELVTVVFYTDFGQAANLPLAVAQACWESGDRTETGPVSIYSCSDQVGAEKSQYSSWLMASDSLLLTDPVTGEQAELIPAGMADEDADGPDDWAGMRPKSGPGVLIKFDQGPGPAWIRGGLRYEQGQLRRADTGQALTFQLFMAPGTGIEQ